MKLLRSVISAACSAIYATAIASLLVLPLSAPFNSAHAAASSQVTHAYLCQPDPAAGQSGPKRVTNGAGTNAYVLNSAGCAVILGADVSYFQAQGYSQGPNMFTLRQEGITGSGTSAVVTTMTLPAYGYIVGFVMCETAGNAVTGGLNIGDAGSATRFGSAVALGANACVTVADSALTRQVTLSGVPTAATIQLAAVTSWNSASVNVTVLYSYF